MRQFDTINILDMLGAIGETELKKCLSDFHVRSIRKLNNS